MLRFANWRLASVLALVAAAVLVILPSFMPTQAVDALAARFPSFIPMRQIVLGLDLQGGAYLLMEVDTPSVTKSQIEALRDGRFAPSFADVRRVALPALRHRVLLNFDGEAEGVTSDVVVNAVLAGLPEL